MPTPPPPADQLVFGPYRPPRFRVGGTLRCQLYGSRPVVGVSAARVPWPLVRAGPRRRAVPALVGTLARAVRLEARQAVAYWWGVSDSTVTKWRTALGVPEHNPGTVRLRRAAADALLHTPAARAKVAAAARDPARAAATVARQRGKRRPPEVVAKMRAAMAGRVIPRAWRANISQGKQAAGTKYRAAGRPWTAADDEVVRQLAPSRAARRLGRSPRAVRDRRRALGST